MHTQNRVYEFVIVILLVGVFSWLYFSNLDDVPFHPDESTQIFMSSDIDQFLTNPLSLAWIPDSLPDPRLRYRLIDAPLTRTVIGMARMFAAVPSLRVDWNWSKDWQDNQNSGALPPNELLHLARMSVSIIYPLTLLCMYFTVKETFSTLPAVIATILLASHALILLHTRRAMAESLLVFTVCLSIYALTKYSHHPWLSAIPIALAINAKQSALPLVLVGLLAILIYASLNKKSKMQIAAEILCYGFIIAVFYFILNPVLWKHPIQAFQESLITRSVLTRQQISTIQSVDNQKTLISISQKIAGLIGNIFITPPAIQDVANYTNELQPSAQLYLGNPFHTLFRGFTGGAVILVFSLMGFLFSKKFMDDITPIIGRKILIIITATVLQLITNIFMFTLPFQRYAITLVPYTCIWCAVGLAALIKAFLNLIPDKKKGMQSS